MDEIIPVSWPHIEASRKLTNYQLNKATIKGHTADAPPYAALIIEAAECSDGHHTFDELYEHRNLLFIGFLYGLGWFTRQTEESFIAWKSKIHSDGTTYDGWFIAGAVKVAAERDSSEFLMHTAISYHLPLSMWDLLKVTEWPKALEYDGYTPNDVLERIRKYYL